MKIMRSGPPTTHDSVLWRVPLDGRPSAAWQKAFETADEPGTACHPKRVHFEPDSLTFRAQEREVTEWVAAIDRYIRHANEALSAVEQTARNAADRAQANTDQRRQRATDANERFKDL
jgi:hypothetical protein